MRRSTLAAWCRGTFISGAIGSRIAAKYADYLTNVNAGDTAAVAHTQKLEKYYTQGETIYANAMARTKAEIDKALGLIP